MARQEIASVISIEEILLTETCQNWSKYQADKQTFTTAVISTT